MNTLSIIITVVLSVFTAVSIPMAFLALKMLHSIQLTIAKIDGKLSLHTENIRELRADNVRQDKDIERIESTTVDHGKRIVALETRTQNLARI